MRCTVQIAAANVAAMLLSGSGFAAANHRVAAELDQNLDDLGAYLDATGRRFEQASTPARRHLTMAPANLSGHENGGSIQLALQASSSGAPVSSS